MRSRLLVGLSTAIIVLATVLPPLSAAASGPAVPHGAGALVVPTHSAPAPGVCLPSAQQCRPVVPQGVSGTAPAVALVALLVAAVLALLPPSRLRRRHRSGRLAAGFVATMLHPPRAGLGTV